MQSSSCFFDFEQATTFYHFVNKLSLELFFRGAAGDLVERECPVGVEDLLVEDQGAGCAGKGMA